MKVEIICVWVTTLGNCCLGVDCFKHHVGPKFSVPGVHLDIHNGNAEKSSGSPAPAPHLLSPFLAHQPSPHWKLLIARLDMHHLVFGINFQIHFVSLNSPVLIHLLTYLSMHPCHHRHSQHPSLLHSFTPGSNLPFQQILPTLTLLLYSLDCLHDNGTGPDLSCLSVYF